LADGASRRGTNGIVAAHRYCKGVRVGPVGLDARPSQEGRDPTEFVWIGLCEPPSETLRDLQRRFDLHPLAVEDALKAHQLPKIDIYGGQLFIVLRTAAVEGDRISYGETALFIGPRHLVSVRHGSARAHETLRAQLESTPELLARGVAHILHAILDFVVDGYLPIIEAMGEEVSGMEQRALDNFLEPHEVRRIFTMRRELARFQRMMGPMSEVCAQLARLDMPCISPGMTPYFSDVLDHVRRVEMMAGALRDTLSSVFEISSLLEQQRQGAITRQLAAWAAILAVPTAIAGIYGMNFRNMPELQSDYGYFVVIGVIASSCLLLYMKFRRSGWLM